MICNVKPTIGTGRVWGVMCINPPLWENNLRVMWKLLPWNLKVRIPWSETACLCRVTHTDVLILGIQLEEEEEEEGIGGVERWGLRLWPRIDDSVMGREGSPPACHSPPTSNMPYYGDLWRWLGSTFNWVRPGPSKDLSLHKIKGGQGVCQTKANSEGQRRSRCERFIPRQPSHRRKTQRTSQALWRLPFKAES